jgi:capsular polysaccharide transport system permease protein
MDMRLDSIGMLKAQGRVLAALMLHDLKTRFFGNEFGFLLTMGWPLTHILVLLIINTSMGRAVPYGESPALWFATGVIPFAAFNYMARFIMLGIVLNRPLLSFPIVKITDILFARSINEVLSAGVVVLIMFTILWAFDVDFMPTDVVQAASAMLAMMLLGLGYGVVNAVIAAAIPGWITGYALLTILLWASSSIFFVPDALPEQVRVPLSYLPTVQGVEWMRSAYYDGYGAYTLDKLYMLSCSVVILFTGLAIERAVRGKMLA